MKTLIAIPCMSMVHADFMKSVLELEKPEDTSVAVIKNSLIYTARNTIAVNAVRHGFDRVMWLDSDMILPPDAMTKLAKHLDAGADFVTGLYFARSFPTQPIIYETLTWELKRDSVVTDAKTYFYYPKDQLFEIAGCGFGCVMTSARMLKKLLDVYGSPFHPLMGMGEDMSFCYRATQQGIKMYCDSTVKCGHIGEKIYGNQDYRY